MKGKIFADWSIQCGRCERQESLGTHTKSVANQRRSERGWIMRRAYGYNCPECRHETADGIKLESTKEGR